MFSRGVRYMLLSSFFFALMNVVVKFLPHLPATEIAFFRSFASLGLTVMLIRMKHIQLPGNNIRALILRGIFGAASLIFYFVTLQRMPLASAVTIQFLSPIFTTVLGIFLVKETVKPVQWLFFLMAFGGVLFIQGFDSRVEWIDVVFGVASAIASALAYNTIRMLRGSEHPFVIIFYFPLITLPIAGLFMSFDFVVPLPLDWLLLILIGILAQLAQYFMTLAYQAEELSRVSGTRYFGIIYALLFGFLFFGETFSWQVYIGIVIVLVAVVLNIKVKVLGSGF